MFKLFLHPNVFQSNFDFHTASLYTFIKTNIGSSTIDNFIEFKKYVEDGTLKAILINDTVYVAPKNIEFSMNEFSKIYKEVKINE